MRIATRASTAELLSQPVSHVTLQHVHTHSQLEVFRPCLLYTVNFNRTGDPDLVNKDPGEVGVETGKVEFLPREDLPGHVCDRYQAAATRDRDEPP